MANGGHYHEGTTSHQHHRAEDSTGQVVQETAASAVTVSFICSGTVWLYSPHFAVVLVFQSDVSFKCIKSSS